MIRDRLRRIRCLGNDTLQMSDALAACNVRQRQWWVNAYAPSCIKLFPRAEEKERERDKDNSFHHFSINIIIIMHMCIRAIVPATPYHPESFRNATWLTRGIIIIIINITIIETLMCTAC